jgi:hypothetical protein
MTVTRPGWLTASVLWACLAGASCSRGLSSPDGAPADLRTIDDAPVDRSPDAGEAPEVSPTCVEPATKCLSDEDCCGPLIGRCMGGTCFWIEIS